MLITTGDRDAFQLVSDNVTVLYPTRGVSELGRIDPDAVMASYGLTPQQYPDFAALRGDPSATTCPTSPGVGEKTAAKWVREFGSLAELTDRVDEVKGKAGDALRAHLANVLLNRQLTELVRDVPLDVDAGRARPCGRGTATPCTGCSTSWSSGCCASGCSPRCRAPSRRPRAASRCRAARSRRARLRAWLDAHARDGRRVGLAFRGITGGATGGDLAGIALAAGEPTVEARAAGAAAGVPQAATSTSPRSPRTTRRRWASGWPTRPCPRPRTTPSRRCTRCAAAAGRCTG